MNSFWDNISKFPKFLIAIVLGFFLTTFNPIFELLKSRKKTFFLTIIFSISIYEIYQILRLMLGKN